MELNEFLPTSDTITVQIKNPKTDEVVGYIEGYLGHTEEFTEAQYELFAKVTRDEDGNIADKDAAKLTLELLAARVKSWDFTQGGEPVDVSRAKEIFTKLRWVARQFQEGVEEAEDFI